MGQVKILDIDKFDRDKRVIKIAGKKLDVSKVPSRITLKLAKMRGDLANALQDEGAFERMIEELVIPIMKPSFPEVDIDWILDNTNTDELLELINFTLAPLTGEKDGENVSTEEDGVKKNQQK